MTDEQVKILLNPPSDGTIPTRDHVFELTFQFVQSDFYKLVWKPKFEEERELAKKMAKISADRNLRVSWLDRLCALEAIEDAWFPEWLADKIAEGDEDEEDGE